jgi:hypothetical protein
MGLEGHGTCVAPWRGIAPRSCAGPARRAAVGPGPSARPLPRLPPPLQVAALRTLLGVCSVLLSNFKTSLEDDEALLALGAAPASASTGTGTGTGTGGAADAPGGSPGPAAPLGEELRLAVGFRAERKRVLARVIRALSSRARLVAGMSGLREGPVTQAKKGERPRPATDRGFATGNGNGNGRPRGGGGGGGKG